MVLESALRHRQATVQQWTEPWHHDSRPSARRLDAGPRCRVPKTDGVCRESLTRRHALWRFVRHARVALTHNAAERAMRPAVLWRQGRFGPQSLDGSRFVDARMTVVAPLTPHPCPVLDYLTAACEEIWCGLSAPSLLPTPDRCNDLLDPAA
jgi:hypothetical protein